ncbi:MAG: biopolymer transporter ExbB [Rhodobacterales bacterium]|nr:biopolymer transporter ExbB [Rhodobacterales bacterium]
MDKTPRQKVPFFSQPVRQILLMIVVVGLLAAGVWLILPVARGVVLTNLWLNGAILFVFGVGLLSCFWQMYQLIRSVSWIETVTGGPGAGDGGEAPLLMAPLAALLRDRGARMQIPASSARSILDSVATRMDESRDVTRYLGNLLIFLGLLGTFYGLATTVPAIVETIRALAPQEGETGLQVFEKLMGGLQSQLGGMGTAFSSSLLGLSGSLVIGLLDLFAGHGQNRFYRELEEWMSTITRLGFSSAEGEGGSAEVGILVAGLEQIAEQLEGLRAQLAEAAQEQALAQTRLTAVMDRLHARLGALDAQTEALTRLAQGQDRLVAALTGAEGGAHVDAESRMRLRSIDVQLLRILEEISVGRQESITDLRADLASLTQAIRALSRGQGR